MKFAIMPAAFNTIAPIMVIRASIQMSCVNRRLFIVFMWRFFAFSKTFPQFYSYYIEFWWTLKSTKK